MVKNKPVIVSFTSWEKRLVNVVPVILSIASNNVKPDAIICNLSIEEFPEKEKSLITPINDLIKAYPAFKINWVQKNTGVFKKFIPTLIKFYGQSYYLFTIDDDELYDSHYIETGLKLMENYKVAVIANRPISETGVWGGLTCYDSSVFSPDYWQKITPELIEKRMNDPYTNEYLRRKNISIGCSFEKHSQVFNDCFSNRGGRVYTKEQIENNKKIVTKTLNGNPTDNYKELFL